MGICHFNTSDISQLALPMIDVGVFSKIHKVGAVLEFFVFVSEADILPFANLILAVAI